MNKYVIVGLVVLFSIATVVFAHDQGDNYYDADDDVIIVSPEFRGDRGFSTEFDGGTLTITDERNDEVIEITEDYELFVDGHQVDLNRDQARLVKDFYRGMKELDKDAEVVGLYGAAIGVKGARVGISAARNVLRAFLSNEDMEGLEIELDEVARDYDMEKLEIEAEKLEKRAEELEENVEELEDIWDEMTDEIEELEDLHWSSRFFQGAGDVRVFNNDDFKYNYRGYPAIPPIPSMLAIPSMPAIPAMPSLPAVPELEDMDFDPIQWGLGESGWYKQLPE